MIAGADAALTNLCDPPGRVSDQVGNDVRVQQVASQTLHRLEQGALAHRLDDQTITGTVHDRFVARPLELNRNADRLVPPLRNNLTCLASGTGDLLADAGDICRREDDGNGPLATPP
jgi:hypothetical protein